MQFSKRFIVSKQECNIIKHTVNLNPKEVNIYDRKWKTFQWAFDILFIFTNCHCLKDMDFFICPWQLTWSLRKVTLPSSTVQSNTMCGFSLTFSLHALCSHSTLSLLGRLAWRIILISPQASFGRQRIHSCLKFIKPIWRYIWKEMTLEAKRGGIGAASVDKMIPDDVHSQAVTWPHSWHAFEKDR